MPTIAIVGAGPGLGLAVARQFGKLGFDAALIARRQESLDSLTAQLKADGIKAAGFVADVSDEAQIADAFGRIKKQFGSVDVMEFSPMPPMAMFTAAGTTTEQAMEYFRGQTLAAVASARQVLPDLMERKAGALLFTTGASAAIPVPMLAPVGIALSGLRNYAWSLHQELKPTGIYVGHVCIGVQIKEGAGEADPNAIAAHHRDLFEKRDRFEELVGVEALRKMLMGE